jgi:hypothetical protein
MPVRDGFDTCLKHAKIMIDTNYVTSFHFIFVFLERKRFASLAEIGYKRFLDLLKKPHKMTCLEAERAAKVLNISYRRMIELLENDNERSKT